MFLFNRIIENRKKSNREKTKRNFILSQTRFSIDYWNPLLIDVAEQFKLIVLWTWFLLLLWNINLCLEKKEFQLTFMSFSLTENLRGEKIAKLLCSSFALCARKKKRSFNSSHMWSRLFLNLKLAFADTWQSSQSYRGAGGGPQGIGNFDQWTFRVNKQSKEILFLTAFASVAKPFKHRRRFAKQCWTRVGCDFCFLLPARFANYWQFQLDCLFFMNLAQ